MPRIAVNVSSLQFADGKFIALVERTLAESGFPASLLELEITETALMDNLDQVIEQIEALRRIGVRFAIDDFGTGYSSLSHLQNLPVDCVKIDRSFTADTHRTHGGEAIVQAIATLGANLGIETTAEGVETLEQLEAMRRAGCTEVQGFLLSRPRPVSELPAVFVQFSRHEDVR